MLVRHSLCLLLFTVLVPLLVSKAFSHIAGRDTTIVHSSRISISTPSTTGRHSNIFTVGFQTIRLIADTTPSVNTIFDSLHSKISSASKDSNSFLKGITTELRVSMAGSPSWSNTRKLERRSDSSASGKNRFLLKPNSISKYGDSFHSPKKIFNGVALKPTFRSSGGFVAYNFNYRSSLDTPYKQQNLMQHLVNGAFNFSFASFPMKLTFLARKSNSVYFKDIMDARLEFDPYAYQSQLMASFRDDLVRQLNGLKDSSLDLAYLNQLSSFEKQTKEFNLRFPSQRLLEMNEIIRVPAISYDLSLPDSVAKRKSDSLRNAASTLMRLYKQGKEQLQELSKTVDSLKNLYYRSVIRTKKLKEALNGKFGGWKEFREWKEEARQYTNNRLIVPKKYEWLLGVRNFSVGKTPLNYSELTARNINVSGVNFEFNTWYYLSLTAGLVDYRFRDFSYQPFKRTPQYLYMIRAGLGDIDRNHFIISAFRGQKQLYATSREGDASSYDVTGIAVEAKYFLLKNTYLLAELAESAAADYRNNPPVQKRFLNLSDKTNKAYSFKISSYVPRTNSKVELFYKYTGANYQSFNSFQSSSEFVSWHIKAEQNLFRRRLKFSASVKANEFSNPYIVQAYKSNTVFKSLQATFHKRKWPTINIGYVPMSQLTKIGNQLMQNTFQTLNASVNHTYKLGTQQSTTVVFTRFYNQSSDSGFIYFNASNFFLCQNFFFNSFNATAGYSQTRNPEFVLNVIEGSFELPISSKVNIGAGAKINSLNQSDVKVGYSAKLNIRSSFFDALNIVFEKGYLSGRKGELVSNDFLNVGIMKSFR